ncbi:cation-translocating P-type ATPase [Caulobacter sp.]|uniref:cation-translocating P-type ATPase n=1 Tax=Caulobacter sp. TaxID=78 RepID=UPI002B4A5E77|nr:cation-translocating P-type ATPase [Caulobacter sp.]HJV40735.1 cation-translocating P-type ATPase [Caulobacter sp.]
MDAGRLQGLSQEEAAARLREAGPNEIPSEGARGFWRIAAETMREPMFLLLIGAALLYLVLGDLGEGLFLLGGAAASVGLVILQEARSERALAALRELAQPTARVIRDGVEQRIQARELAPGDILLIGEGERLPADGVLVAGEVLSVDESALTGESAPVARQPARTLDGGAESALFSGTMVVRGQGLVLVEQTGASSALGKIGASLADIEQEQTPLQKTAGRLIGLLGGLALAFCALVVVAYGVLRGDWIQGILSGITVAISLIPEEFPMILAVFLALGAWRLATHKVLVRRSAVVETLGGATVLCVDKTGTLTENRMRVARVWANGSDVAAAQPSAEAVEVIRLAALASAVRPVDPMDKAVKGLATTHGAPDLTEQPEQAWPLRPEMLAVIQVWRGTDDGRTAAAKGAPEAIFRLCHLDTAETERLHEVVRAYAEQGLRVLGVASASLASEVGGDPLDMPFAFAGLLGFIDPLRAEVPAALQEARGAGVKVVMITGDHPATALAIAREAGIEVENGVLTGADVAALPFEALCEQLRRVRVFARIAPEQKLRLVEALKADGEIVAMTGDGVNDAPALEAAHIGVAMGQKGTDVAREAADLILLDDSFASIVGAVRLGRRIFANLRRALTYVTAIHVPIAGMALGPVLLGLPPMLMPMHVVLLELVIDPTCALVFEAEPSERDTMKRPPRRADEALFGLRQIRMALIQGLALLAAVLGVYLWALTHSPSAEQARGAAFVTLAVGILSLALADSMSSGRIFAPHRWTYWLIASAVAAILALMMWAAPVAQIFEVARPPAALLVSALAAGVTSGAWVVAWRTLRRDA